MLEGLQPNPNLQNLEIQSFRGKEFPSWFKYMVVCPNQNNHNLSQGFNRLVSQSLISCKKCKSLPILGQLPSHKYLKLFGLDNISGIEPSFYGIDGDHDYNGSENNIKSEQRTRKIFPTLTDLEVKWMENLKEWMEYQASDNDYVEIFPNLENLLIQSCSKLRLAPIHYFSSVKDLTIDGTDLDVFENIAKYEIFNRSPANAITPHVQKGIFTSLETLYISDCPNLSVLPEYLYEFKSLRDMAITGCPNLKSFPTPMGSQQRLTSLQNLKLQECNGLTILPHELLTSSVSLTVLHISHCHGLSNLPADFLESCGSSLQLIVIRNLSNLESFSFELQQTPSLSSLILYNLPKLITLPKLEPSISCSSRLSNLSIGGFSDSVEFYWSQLPRLSTSLRILVLKRWPNLVSLLDQLQHFTGLKELGLLTLTQIEALPDWFANFVSLERLRLCDCEKLSYLPSTAAMRSLTKLTDLDINLCPLLKERCIRRNSPDSEWSKISHIPSIAIDGARMESGKWLACLPSKTRE